MKLFGVQITSPKGELWKLAKLGLDINCAVGGVVLEVNVVKTVKKKK